MGIASNKRYQLVRGLRRSLRMTPPFTGRTVRDGDESKQDALLSEVDRAPAPDPVKAVRLAPIPAKEVVTPAASPAVPVPTPAAEATMVKVTSPTETAPEPATTSSAETPALSLFGSAIKEDEGPAVQLPAVEATRSSSATSALATTPAVPADSTTSTSLAAAAKPAVRSGGTSVWSFAAGLVLGVAGSSAAWSWVTNLQAAEPAALHAPVAIAPAPVPETQTSLPLFAAAGPKKEGPASSATAPEVKPSKALVAHEAAAEAPPADEKKGKAVEAPAAAPAKEVPASPPPPEPPVQQTPAAKPAPAPAPPPEPAAEPAPPTPPRAAPANDFDKWKSTQIAEIEAKFPELHPWFNTVMEGAWNNNGRIVNGTSVIKARTPAHTALIKWLNLEPPPDPDTRRAVHNVVIRLLTTEDCLALWEPLVKNGASNTPDIHNAADALLASREGRLSETDKARVKALIEASAPKGK